MAQRTFLCLWIVTLVALAAAVPRELESHVAAYIKLRKQAVREIPALKPKAEPEQIEAHRSATASAIRNARKNAKQGDILTRSTQEYLVDLVRSEMKGREGIPAKKSAKQGNPRVEESAPVHLRVNSVDPDNASASTMPATLLQRFPKLPKELDFRFVGRHLVLRDVPAGLIIDYVPNAME